jgi:hypothetical protein
MSTEEYIRKLALSLPEVTEEPHFEKIAFKVKKKIFLTHNLAKNRVCVKLSESDQDLFSLADNTIVYAVSNKFGKQGWTLIELEKVNEALLIDAIKTAYCEVAPQKLAQMVDFEE